MNPQSTVYLTLEQVIAVHDNQIQRYGGSHGIRDLGLLESAIYRIQVTFAGKDLYPTIFDKAGALLQSLVLNHAFIDGNKRTGTVCCLMILELNNYCLIVSEKELLKEVVGICQKEVVFKEISLWLKKHAKKI
jgi:death-on-curing protein